MVVRAYLKTMIAVFILLSVLPLLNFIVSHRTLYGKTRVMSQKDLRGRFLYVFIMEGMAGV